MKTPLRRTAAAGALLLLTLGLSSCGFNVQTNQVYQPAVGVNDRSGEVDVLDALIVSATNGSGTLVTSLVDNNQTVADQLTGISGDGLTSSPAQAKIPAGGLVNLADSAPITITGDDVQAGNFVRITLTFQNANPVTVNVPVVPHTGDYAGIDVTTLPTQQ